MLPGNRPTWLGDHSRSIMIIRKSQRFLWIINHEIMILRKSLVWEKEMKNAILDKILVSVSHIGHHFCVRYRREHRKLAISQKWLWKFCICRLNSGIFQRYISNENHTNHRGTSKSFPEENFLWMVDLRLNS